MINKILITELGFWTTTYNRCIYIQEHNDKLQLLSQQVDDLMLGTTSNKTTRDLFNDVVIKIQFPSEVEANIIPFEFLGVFKDYNGVNIIQTPDYTEISSWSYIKHLLKSHGWDTLTPKQLPNKNIPSSKIILDVPTITTAALVHKI